MPISPSKSNAFELEPAVYFDVLSARANAKNNRVLNANLFVSGWRSYSNECRA